MTSDHDAAGYSGFQDRMVALNYLTQERMKDPNAVAFCNTNRDRV